MRHTWLKEKEFLYNCIHKLLNYGIQASKNSTTVSQLRWSPDNIILHIDGDGLIISKLKEFAVELLVTAENMCSKDLFRSDRWLPKAIFMSSRETI